MGYNLAIEYLADAEKTWMLDSFRSLDARVLQRQQRALSQWLFLEVGPIVLLPPSPDACCCMYPAYTVQDPGSHRTAYCHIQYLLLMLPRALCKGSA
jgi:hypothetical protein